MTTRAYKFLDIAIGDSVLPLFYSSAAPVNGTSGTFAGVAIPSALLITAEPAFYQNTNTLASPTWTAIETSGGAGSFTTLAASGAVSGAGFTALFASPPAIGGTAPAAVAATALSTTIKGTFTCNQTTPVTVTDANVTANSVIIITLKTVGGTVGATPHVATITPTTGFTTVGSASDTSVYNYAIIN